MRRLVILIDGLAAALAVAGMYVAGTLALHELSGAEVPCGASEGCGRVAASAAGHFLGLPTALWGLFAYVLLFALAWGRVLAPRRAAAFHRAGYALSGLGLLASAGLVAYATFGVRAVCPWCLASASAMASLFGVHALRAHLGAPDPPRSAWRGVALLTLLAAGGAAFHARGLAPSVPYDPAALARVSREGLIPSGAHHLGNAYSKTVVVMFGDLTCLACRNAYLRLRRSAHPGGAALVFRHFPLPSHSDALLAGTLAEAAGEGGRFWPFLDRVYRWEAFSEESALGDLAELGVDQAGLERSEARIQRLRGKVLADARLARSLGLQVTPTLILVRAKRVPRVVGLDEAVRVLNG